MFNMTTSLATALTRASARAKGLAFATTLMAGLVAPIAVSAPAANATYWDPHVHVAGRASCGSGFSSYTANRVEMWGGGNYVSSYVNAWGNYGVDFWNVSWGGYYASVRVTCKGIYGTSTYSRSFLVFRPAVGTQINVNFGQ